MNRKGQVLVIFIILLPIIIMAFALVTDLGLLLVKTTSIKNNIKEVINYGLDSDDIDKEVMLDLLKTNLGDNNTYSIEITNQIIVKVSGSYESIFKKVFNRDSYNYSYIYVGYKKDNKNIIEKEG